MSLIETLSRRDFLIKGAVAIGALALGTACSRKELTPEQKKATADQTLQEMAKDIRNYQILQIGLQPDKDSRIGRLFYPDDTAIKVAKIKINHPLFLEKLIQAVLENYDDKSSAEILLIQRGGENDKGKIDFIFGVPASDLYFRIPYEVMMAAAAKHDIRNTDFLGLRKNPWAQEVAKNPGIEARSP